MKTKEAILKEHLSPIYDHPDDMDDYLCNHYEEIYAAMETYTQQANEGLREALEKIKYLMPAFPFDSYKDSEVARTMAAALSEIRHTASAALSKTEKQP